MLEITNPVGGENLLEKNANGFKTHWLPHFVGGFGPRKAKMMAKSYEKGITNGVLLATGHW